MEKLEIDLRRGLFSKKYGIKDRSLLIVKSNKGALLKIEEGVVCSMLFEPMCWFSSHIDMKENQSLKQLRLNYINKKKS